MYGYMPQMTPNYTQNQFFNQHQEITRVNGENGARAYNLTPNSSALLLDESAPLVWLVTADGAGYKTVTPYEIKPYAPKPTVSNSDLETRIKRLEDIINESYSSAAESAKQYVKKPSSAKTGNPESRGIISDDA